MHEAFLDSSILWAYVGPARFEPDHHSCVAIFERTDIKRYTSETVSGEVKQSEVRRARLYSELIAHFRLKKQPEEFDVTRFSRHVEARARQLLRTMHGNEADIEFLRSLGEMESARLRGARSKIEQPLVPSKKDPYFEDSLRASLGIESGDAKVLADYLAWASAHEQSRFLTGDGKLLDRLRAGLSKFLTDRFIETSSVNDFKAPKEYLASLPT